MVPRDRPACANTRNLAVSRLVAARSTYLAATVPRSQPEVLSVSAEERPIALFF